MHSLWTVYTLFITVKIVSQSQQIRKKKKSRKRELINVDAEPKQSLSDRLLWTETHVYVSSSRFPLFFFFFQPTIVDFVNCEQCICVLFTVLQLTLFSNFFIKNGSHNTIYIFKNYFALMFSVSVFSFSKNKLNPNTPLMSISKHILRFIRSVGVGRSWSRLK